MEESATLKAILTFLLLLFHQASPATELLTDLSRFDKINEQRGQEKLAVVEHGEAGGKGYGRGPGRTPEEDGTNDNGFRGKVLPPGKDLKNVRHRKSGCSTSRDLRSVSVFLEFFSVLLLFSLFIHL